VTGGGVCIVAIVVNAQSSESGKERDEIETAVFVAPEDIQLGDVVTSPAHASLDALDMKVRIGKTCTTFSPPAGAAVDWAFRSPVEPDLSHRLQPFSQTPICPSLSRPRLPV